MNRISVLGIGVDAVDFNRAAQLVCDWAIEKSKGRYVVFANAHVVVTAAQDQSFGNILNEADLVAPDGFPVAWMLRRLGATIDSRVPGPDLMVEICRRAEISGARLFFYGSTQDTLDKLLVNLRRLFPNINIVGAISPPFRMLTQAERDELIDSVRVTDPHMVFVGLGCPKQEQWMFENVRKLNVVMLGVGAAFDFHAGVIRRAPLWIGRFGFEWLYRLLCEPRRLFRRYLVTNSLFLYKSLRQLYF